MAEYRQCQFYSCVSGMGGGGISQIRPIEVLNDWGMTFRPSVDKSSQGVLCDLDLLRLLTPIEEGCRS